MASLKTVLVTGGNGGIGYETVKAFYESEKTYRILMGSRSMDKAKAAIEQLHAECPSATNIVEAVELDIANDESIEKAYTKVQSDVGYLDALVNNAGK
jgi:NAD(P)-dependent dehydrogenase (short-subunit alcohol dehydrogenase family)